MCVMVREMYMFATGLCRHSDTNSQQTAVVKVEERVKIVIQVKTGCFKTPMLVLEILIFFY